MKVIVKHQLTKEIKEEVHPIQYIAETEIEVDEAGFNLAEIVDIINGAEVDENNNRLSGFMVGDKNYFRALEVVSIEVANNEEKKR